LPEEVRAAIQEQQQLQIVGHSQFEVLVQTDGLFQSQADIIHMQHKWLSGLGGIKYI
jgi:hypothetical protein